MYRALIAVWCVVIATTGSEVERSAYLLVKENVADCTSDVGIDSDCKFTHISCALVGVENGVCLFGVVGGCFDDFAVPEFKTNVFKTEAVLDGRGIVTDISVYAFFDGSGVNFTVGDIARTVAFDCGNTLIENVKSVSFARICTLSVLFIRLTSGCIASLIF